MVELKINNPPAADLSPLDDGYEPPPSFIGLRQYEADLKRIAERRRFRIIRKEKV